MRAVIGLLIFAACASDPPTTAISTDPPTDPPADPPSSPPTSRALFGGTECSEHAAGAGWENLLLPQETSSFHIAFRITPHATNIDAVFGLSNGPASHFTDLAAITRFSPGGIIDVRNAGDYNTNGHTITYVAEHPYAVWMDINLGSHTYGVEVEDYFGFYGPIAQSFAFRTEQATLGRMDNFAQEIDSADGSYEICPIEVSSPCMNVAPQGWNSEPFPAASGHLHLHVRAIPQNYASQLDGVVGLSSGEAHAFSDLAAIVRFNPDGYMDARDGNVYRAVSTFAYRKDFPVSIDFDIDVGASTYSATVADYDAGPYITIAQDFAFRTEQQHVGQLDHVASYIDQTDGFLSVCGLTLY